MYIYSDKMSEEDGAKRIKISVDRSKEVEAERQKTEEAEKRAKELEARLQEKEAIIEQHATEQFAKEKEALEKQLKDAKMSEEEVLELMEKVDNPKSLETMQNLLPIMLEQAKKVEKDLTSKKLPSGKSTNPSESGNSNEAKTEKEIIQRLYAKRYDTSLTKQERDEVERQINQLWRSVMSNPSLSSLKKEGGSKKDFSTCPTCQTLNESPSGSKKVTCANCNKTYEV